MNVYGARISNPRFADNIDFMAESQIELQNLTDKVDQSSKRLRLRINKQKTKVMTFSKKARRPTNNATSKTAGQVKEFIYRI